MDLTCANNYAGSLKNSEFGAGSGRGQAARANGKKMNSRIAARNTVLKKKLRKQEDIGRFLRVAPLHDTRW